MMVGQGFLSGSPSFSLYNVDYPDCTATVALRSERTLSLSHTTARSQKKRPFFFFVCFSFSFYSFSLCLSPHPFVLSSPLFLPLFRCSLPSRLIYSHSTNPSFQLVCVCACDSAILSCNHLHPFFSLAVVVVATTTTHSTKPWILLNARSSLYFILHQLPS